MKKFLKSLTVVALIFTLALTLTGCGNTENTGNNNGENTGNSDTQNKVKYVMKLTKDNNNMYNAEHRNYTSSYSEYTFNSNSYMIGVYTVYEFESAEEAQKYIDYHVNNNSKDRSKYSLEGSVLTEDITDTYTYLGASLSSIKELYNEDEYTVEEK